MKPLRQYLPRPPQFTLQGRLALGLSIAAWFLFAGLAISIGKRLEIASLEQLEQGLDNECEAVLALMRPLANGHWLFSQGQLSPIYQRPFSGQYLQIQAGDQVFRSRSLWDEELPLVKGDTGNRVVEQLTGPLNRPLLAITRTYMNGNQPLRITVATDLTSTRKYIAKLQRSLMVYGLASLLVMLIVQYLILKRTLRPLKQTKQQLKALQSGDIGRLDEHLPGELIPLVRQVNALLQTLDQRLERSRKGLGNLAHALKTPLAVLTQLSQHNELPPQVRGTLERRTQEIRQLIDRELKRARLAGGGQPAQMLEVGQEVNDLAETLKLIYRDKGLDITCDISPDAGFRGDSQDFMELLGNLCDNACKWAQYSVRISLTGNLPLHITIEDDGPGIPEADREALLQRGKRLDESRHGSGLGLSIVKDIIDLYEGDLEMGHSDKLGGLLVKVEIGAGCQ